MGRMEVMKIEMSMEWVVYLNLHYRPPNPPPTTSICLNQKNPESRIARKRKENEVNEKKMSSLYG